MSSSGPAAWRLAATLVAVATAIASATTVGSAAGSSPSSPTPTPRPPLRLVEATPGRRVTPSAHSPITPAARRVVPGHVAARVAARVAAHVPSSASHRAAARPAAPGTVTTVTRSFVGQTDSAVAPSDSTGAVGTTRFVELVNRQAALYTKASSTPIATAALGAFVGAADGANVFDPQVMWDAATERFYVVTDTIMSATDNRLSYAYSRTATPNNLTTDWCRYELPYGVPFPDFPKLGDSRDFVVIGVNVFGPDERFTGSDIITFGKPPAGSSCMDASDIAVKSVSRIRHANGSTFAFTPVPTQSVDDGLNGWVVARAGSWRPGGASQLFVYKVSTNARTGEAVLQRNGRSLSVPTYDAPFAAAQKSADPVLTAMPIDTSDARPTQGFTAINPARGIPVVWVQHTVLGGAGAAVRWYEIDPRTTPPSVLATGLIASPTKFLYNAAIAPDRRRIGTDAAFGDTMALQWVESSDSRFPTIRAITKRTGLTQSAAITVKEGSTLDDGACRRDAFCRFGDYAALTPDPAAPTSGAHGILWGTNQIGNGIQAAVSTPWLNWVFSLAIT